jgi:hypothetical protein
VVDYIKTVDSRLLRVDGLCDALVGARWRFAAGSRVRMRRKGGRAVLQQRLDVVIALLNVGGIPSMRRVSWFLFGWYGGVDYRGWLHTLGRSKGPENFFAHAARSKKVKMATLW